MESIYQIADDIAKLAKEVISEYDDLKHVNLDRVVVCRIKKHIKGGDDVLARCVLLNDRTTFLTNKKYMLEFPIVYDSLSDLQKKIIVRHELLHIDPEEKGIIPHQIGEFFSIINEFGMDWINTYKDVNEKIKLLKQKEKIEKKQKKLEESK